MEFTNSRGGKSFSINKDFMLHQQRLLQSSEFSVICSEYKRENCNYRATIINGSINNIKGSHSHGPIRKRVEAELMRAEIKKELKESIAPFQQILGNAIVL
jgi:hypothetical protein